VDGLNGLPGVRSPGNTNPEGVGNADFAAGLRVGAWGVVVP
jgi:hypothetical protein